jgi:hypothetical protein
MTAKMASVPNKQGHFWAKLIHPSGMPAGEDWKSVDWEVVQVTDNNGEGDEEFSVLVPGIGPPQWLPDFVWGPAIERPRELAKYHSVKSANDDE